MRIPILLVAAALLTGAADTVPIAGSAKLSPADRAAISALEATVLAQINTMGAVPTFTAMAAAGLPGDAAGQLAKIDAACGKAKSAERVETRVLGSSYVRESLVVQHEKCLIKWDFAFAKNNGTWTMNYFNFNSPNGEW
ncbi:hypothetical protein [Novosphingobium sp.]|uniref:hypothetical protein n=1 Tax=Novosphingobium sp. TaxID=1874826 RepID=UPI00286B7305|nr:hypothetical protein [Novosphingobium sp.]